ncbi:MAG: hypothetical protein H6592_06550 [Flavobacteriales bacterium]|nr:hypothetical protein [Flavobacteriales bacterium]
MESCARRTKLRTALLLSLIISCLTLACTNPALEETPLPEEQLPFQGGCEEIPIDSVALAQFWQRFQHAVLADRRTEVVAMLDYPIHQLLVHEWNFSVTCDTAYFAQHEAEHRGTEMTAANALERYDFLFTPALKTMIADTDHRRFLPSQGFLAFFARDFGMGCGSDIALHLYAHETREGWRLAIAAV